MHASVQIGKVRLQFYSVRLPCHAIHSRGSLRDKMHESIPEQAHWLGAVVRGYFAYHAVPSNFEARSVSLLCHLGVDADTTTPQPTYSHDLGEDAARDVAPTVP
jgi:hypothetical protein